MQTKWIEPEQAAKAFGPNLDKFAEYRRRYDPTGRLLNDYFAGQVASIHGTHRGPPVRTVGRPRRPQSTIDPS